MRTIWRILEVVWVAASSEVVVDDEVGGKSNGLTGVFRTSRKETYSSSLPGWRKMTLNPLRPARPARPQRWRNTFGSLGGSIWITRSTWGMSRPRAATSVVRRMDGRVELEKAAKFFCRTLGGCLPWRGTRVKCWPPSMEGRMAGRMCWK